jgi:TonB-linked SusC/RagA family outer membrane protein
MKKTLLSFLLVCYCCAMQVMAQTQSITGKVTSSDDGGPLPGVTVKVKGGTAATSTNGNGQYTISASAGQTLVFTFVGSVTAERVIGSQNVINVILQSDTKNLQEVTITTSFGIKQEKRDLAYSTVVVKGGDVADTKRSNFLNGLQGRSPGVTVTSTSGQPGASASINLRGINSIGGNNQPLFIVDGIRIDNNTFAQGALASNGANRNADYNNRAADINPEDIETYTILKGPEAAALYGSDGASGAIIITTKSGRKGGSQINYSNSFSFADTYRFPQIQTVYDRGTNGASDPTIRSYFGPKYAAGTPIYDNTKNFLQTAFGQIHNLNIQGGDEKNNFYLSGQYRKDNGTFPVASNQKVSIRVKGQSQITPKFNATGSVNYFNNDTRKLNKGATGTFFNLLTWPVNDDITNYLNADGTRRRLTGADASDPDNPYFDANYNINRDRTNRALSNYELSYDPFKWLNLRALGGIDFSNTQGNTLLNPQSSSTQNSPLNGFNATSGISARGIIENYTDNSLTTNTSFLATANKKVNTFRGTLTLGAENYTIKDEVNSFYGEQFYDPTFNSINNTNPTTQRNKNTINQRRRQALFGRLLVNYNEMLTLTVTGRNDWSSTFLGNETVAPANWSYFYPSAGLAFEFTKLGFLKDNSVLSYGKLRFSYAQVGKDAPAPYLTRSNLASQATTGGGYAYDVTGGNPYLKPERTNSFEVGTELQFFNGRLGLDASYYNTEPTNQIINPRTSYGTGFVLQYLNGGSLRNQGIELQLTGSPVKSANFNWNTTVNFTHAWGKVLSLAPGISEYYNSDTYLANIRASIFVGSSPTTIGSFDYQHNSQGQLLINPDNGLPIQTTTIQKTGDRQPHFTMGWQNNFNYKDLSLSFLFDIRHGGDVWNGNAFFLTRRGLSTSTLDRETPRIIPGVLRDGKENSATPTMNTIVVTPYYQQDYYSTATVESQFIEHNINWVRLQDVTLSYRLPKSILGRQHVFKSAGVFVTGTDLFMITNYSGADPNVSGTNAATLGSGASGFDYGTLSTPRTILFGVRVGL